jgi:ubiquinone/menaquinone biosynthesis C-methylase UbiE
MSTEAKVQEHYGSGDLTGRILAGIAEFGIKGERFAADALFPFDQMHGRQLAATREHLGRLGLDKSTRVLDVGSGVGGPARYMAFTFGSRVTGLVLTPAFVEAARELAARTGLSDRIEFHAGSALSMPFADASFDVAVCQYVAMNISDKAGLLSEMKRVVKPGGKLLWSFVAAGKGEPRFPLPWARDPSVSFLIAPEEARRLLEESGWLVLEWSDETELFVNAAPPLSEAAVKMRNVISGEDFGDRAKNFGASLQSGALRSILALAERP